ncbi:uncharacterized protein NEMAJ01_0863 [Nematocida major]|uniref:uncharacterized protein n=1 Tax=Nematocida major TaxID=1912982 RepID=UPI002008B936|nr:uncharacterized protein NEMAJ01_0863 [Nematocida major]KAH9385967.1 hypothetical protein NEMAJ01_0863 [Nematocida major]
MDLTKERIDKLKELEKKMAQLLDKLRNEYSYTLGDPLVDKEGYPRSDIDVYMVCKEIEEYKKAKQEWAPLRKLVEEELLNHFRPETP